MPFHLSLTVTFVSSPIVRLTFPSFFSLSQTIPSSSSSTSTNILHANNSCQRGRKQFPPAPAHAKSKHDTLQKQIIPHDAVLCDTLVCPALNEITPPLP
ncbi:hypothetical protein B9Z19DRAFT_1092706, partial [Tuber borchii]